MRRTVTFRDEQFDQLKAHLLREDGKEHVAFLLFGKSVVRTDPWTQNDEIRLLCREIELIDDGNLIGNQEDQISWRNDIFFPILQRAEAKNFGVGLIHSHPGGYNSFSATDNENEKRLFQLSFNRNGSAAIHASFVMTPPANIIGRVWDISLDPKEIDFFRILGHRFDFQTSEKKEFVLPEFLERQRLAFGEAFIDELSHLRLGVVGCGATGSVIATLLSRLGIGNLLLVDKDTVEASNLNRLHGGTTSDVGLPKAEVLKLYIEKIGLGTNVVSIVDWVSSANARDALKACDVIFGCTDDNSGRMMLNRFAYFYLVPLIDIGLTIHLSQGVPPLIQSLVGRVTVVFPGTRCLNSYGITNSEVAYAEGLRRSDPERYESLKKEAYVIGEGNPSPAVATFTTETATVALNEFITRLQGFRNTGAVDHRLRFFHLDEDLKPTSEPEEDCRICGDNRYWGRGDMDPFLDMV